MKRASDNMFNVLKLIAIMAVTVLMTGCISAKSSITDTADPATSPGSQGTLTLWTVANGDNLWGIAHNERVYNVPEKWPLIYKANLDQIKDADLIYPGQILDIPQDSSQRAINDAIKHAKTRGAWAVGPVEASDLRYLKSSG